MIASAVAMQTPSIPLKVANLLVGREAGIISLAHRAYCVFVDIFSLPMEQYRKPN